MKKTIKAYIADKPLKSMPGKFVPVPVRKGKVGVDQIINAMKYDLPFMEPHTIRSVIETFNRIAAELAADGYNVDTGLVYLRAEIKGTLSKYKLNHSDSKVVISAIPGKKLREVTEETTLQLTHQRGKTKGITYVTATNQQSGEPVTERSIIRIRGHEIKIMGNAAMCGVFLKNTETMEIFQLTNKMLLLNFPKELIFQLPPAITAGKYQVKIVTAFCGTSRLLVKPRTFNHDKPLTVIQDEQPPTETPTI
jgi:hypothetical protein